MRFSFRTVDVWVIRLFLINVFWYLSLFPGRLGFDYSLALKMILRIGGVEHFGEF
jgi:hypothetical protein